MNEIKDGGPAFGELDFVTKRRGGTEGMSLRDWFAGQALGSIPLRQWDSTGVPDAEIITRWARCAYAVADAMLAERAK